jgi:hypothetical protein
MGGDRSGKARADWSGSIGEVRMAWCRWERIGEFGIGTAAEVRSGCSGLLRPGLERQQWVPIGRVCFGRAMVRLGMKRRGLAVLVRPGKDRIGWAAKVG